MASVLHENVGDDVEVESHALARKRDRNRSKPREERRKGRGGARRDAAAQTEGHSSNGVLGSSAKAVDARHTGGDVSSRTFDHILSSWRVSKWSTG